MNKKLIIFLISLLTFPLPTLAHDIMGKVGFYDGLSHPVLGLDHLLAMISVGIISAQIGDRAIWTVPSIFVILMTIGGLFGFLLIVQEFYFVEIGIVFSVILLGIGISIENKIPTKLIMIFVATFGLFHGIAHGLEVPAAANPILFVFGLSPDEEKLNYSVETNGKEDKTETTDPRAAGISSNKQTKRL